MTSTLDDAGSLELRPETRASLKRAHATVWLRVHGVDLSNRQIAVLEESIAFVTPQLYAQPESPMILAREAEIKNKLSCTIGRDAAMEAFSFEPQPASPKASNEPVIYGWLERFRECFAS